ncbi:TM0106 family RecB-like putative nuclease [Methylicorpusculum oleiharenae]|uniref:TM0106 family RecB-like putative nuclease n=1 Tax=Methylicorpusculum oleiharenae TaxID=1338687 RepID=UPI00135BDD67|nr:TM0106 family RecB-like putative nuclease [Methylicorpusculum oleiharenae]MCD2453612.1 TM0106 family RecB-like putative nuclease [Methylicorpusculum oleiharenae]
MRSPFASWMERLAIESPAMIAGIEKDHDPMMALLAAKGNTHEANFLKSLQDTHGNKAIAMVKGQSHHDRATETFGYMQAGYPFIYQAYLSRDGFAGRADFLVKVEGKSNLGDYHYEAWDTKLSQTTRPYFLIQLCCYSWMLASIQGVMPIEAAIVLGDLTEDRFRIARYYSFFDRLKRDFLNAQDAFTADFACMPDPAYCSEHGAWASFATDWIERTDSLAQIAGIRKSHIRKLRAAGVDTMTDFAVNDIKPVKGFPNATLIKLKAQAEIQHASRGLEKPLFKILQNDNGKGLSALPPASALDVFFDIEGHPLYDGGLEYLWGTSYRCPDAAQGKRYAFKDWWAHTPEQEKAAFEGFIDWVYARWKRDNTLHVYHYANYEVAAMRKLSTRYETRIKEVAEMLANGVFVDLYKLVINGLILGEKSYSIKCVEHLYRGKRTTQVANGGESVIFYEMWREQGGVTNWSDNANGYQSWLAEPAAFDWTQWPELKDIRDYNIDDCESTLELVDWLRQQQSLAGIDFKPKTEPDESSQEKSARQIQAADKKKALRDWQERLSERFEAEESFKNDPIAQLVMDLIGFHNRERKPKIWAYFERLEKPEEELFDDDTCLHNAVIIDQQPSDDGVIFRYLFDSKQPVRKDKFATGTIRGTDIRVKGIRFPESETDALVDFIADPDQIAKLGTDCITLFADEPFINTETLETRLCEVAEALFDGRLPGAIQSILNREKPVFKTDFEGNNHYLPITRSRFLEDDGYLHAIISAVEAMDNSTMCIQGPPGAGKTFTAKHIITALVKAGKRVGVMSNSHAAIMNLLDALHEPTEHARIAKVGGFGSTQDAFKERYSEEHFPNYVYRASMNFTKREPYHSFAVIGATAYAFASSTAFESPIDYLFVDEASQVALANLIAVAGCARNLVLMGDQMQLEQPIQGSHPGRSGLSVLDYMLGGHGVIPEDMGIFLERTYRMHPAVCLPLSEVVYEGKLKAATNNDRQRVSVPDSTLIKQTHGVMVVNVDHDGNRQSSEEEVDVIQRLIHDLKTGCFTSKNGEARPIADEDILVVSPYNMQVNLLKDLLGDQIAIGTIDKFQGQEAPVVIISMAVSDVEESSRGLDFLFDINRLNVAVSRAQALAIIVANPGLECCRVSSLQQMEKASFYSRLVS